MSTARTLDGTPQDWPVLREEDGGWSMVFKTSPPTPEHAKLRQVAVFTPTDREHRWVWAVHVDRHAVVTVTYCDHDPMGG